MGTRVGIMTQAEKGYYYRGRAARKRGEDKSSCPFKLSNLRAIKNHHIWLAGWNDKDIEMKG